MNTNQHSTSKAPFISIVAVFAALVLFALFYVVLQQGVWTFVIFVLVIIALAFIGVWLYHLAATAWIKVAVMKLNAIEENHRFELARTKLNYEYHKMLTAPDEKQHRLSQVNFHSLDPITLAANLVMYSRIENGDDSNRICGMPIPGCTGRAWVLGNKYLQDNYGVVSMRGAGGGTFVPDDIGTLYNLYQRMTVNALPADRK